MRACYVYFFSGIVILMSRTWTLLSHHAHLLLALNEKSDRTMSDLAQVLGLTPRHVSAILDDLVSEGYLSKTRRGRNNVYAIHREAPLRHVTSQNRTVGDLLGALGRVDG